MHWSRWPEGGRNRRGGPGIPAKGRTHGATMGSVARASGECGGVGVAVGGGESRGWEGGGLSGTPEVEAGWPFRQWGTQSRSAHVAGANLTHRFKCVRNLTFFLYNSLLDF